MKLEDLKPGQLYRITKATPNPNLDRRVNSEWTRMDLPEGGELLCKFTHNRDLDPDVKAQTIELESFSNLAGNRYSSRALVGWVFDDGRTKRREAREPDDTYGKFVEVLLAVIEPFEPRDVDDALAVFNATHHPEISYEDLAVSLLDESKEHTVVLFERTRCRLELEAFDVETDEDYHEYDRRLREFNAHAYKPVPPVPAPVGDPAFTIGKGTGEVSERPHTCHGCGRVFTCAAGDTNPASAKFKLHLPCKGKVAP